MALFLPGQAGSGGIGQPVPIPLPNNGSNPSSNNPSASPVANVPPGYLTNALIEWVLALLGITIVAIAYERDRRLGGMLLFIVALLMMRAAYNRGLI